MRKLRTSFTTLIVLFILLISCHEPEIEVKREKLQPIAYTSLVQEKALGRAMELAGFSNKSVSGGRLMAGLANYKPDSILKVLQSDSTHYTYTLQLEGGANLSSFRNLVFRRVANGYYGSVVEYSFKNGVFNPEKFTGTINRYDLEGKLFFKATLENGNVTASNSGKINYQCIEFAWEAHDGTPCVPLGSGGPGGDGCSLVMIVSPCGHGSSGGPYTPTPDGGSYVPDPYGAGGGTGGSGSGGSSGGPSAPVDPGNPTYEGEEPIGVLPGKNNAEYLRAKQEIAEKIAEMKKQMDCSKMTNNHGQQTKSLWDFYNKYSSQSRDFVVTRMQDVSITGLGSQPGGPELEFRYIQDPLNPKLVIDMRHMLVIGKYGRAVGESVEFVQWLGQKESAFDDQDYFSNELGYAFYNEYGEALDYNPTALADFLITFLFDRSKRNETTDPGRCP